MSKCRLNYKLYQPYEVSPRDQELRGNGYDLPCILFIHGFLGCVEDFEDLCLQFQKSSISAWMRLLVIDLPYHGGSQYVQAASLSEAAACIHELLDSLEIRNAIVLGYSLGGRVALHLDPERVVAQVLASSQIGIEDEQLKQARYRKDFDLAARLDAMYHHGNSGTALQSFLEQEWYSLPMWGSLLADEQFKEQIISRRVESNSDPRLLARALESFSVGNQASFWQSLEHDSSTPTLYICGEEDTAYCKTAQRLIDISSYQPRIQVRILPQCGHNVIYQDPQSCLVSILGFLWSLLRIHPCYSFVPTSVQYDEYTIPLKRPIQLGPNVTLSVRQGMLLKWMGSCCDRKVVGIGDVAPLPCFSEESLEDARHQWSRIMSGMGETPDLLAAIFPVDALIGNHESGMHTLISKIIGSGLGQQVLYPSIRHGLEMCLLTAILQTRPSEISMVDAFRLLCGRHHQIQPQTQTSSSASSKISGMPEFLSIKVNGVVPRFQDSSNHTACRHELENLSNLGFTTLKLKVGSDAALPHHDSDLVNRLVVDQILPPTCTLRLDANCAWTWNQAFSFLKNLDPRCYSRIEYLEEPCVESKDMIGLWNQWRSLGEERCEEVCECDVKDRKNKKEVLAFSFAMDESCAPRHLGTMIPLLLQQGEDFGHSDLVAIQCMILKPLILGGYSACLSLMKTINAPCSSSGKASQAQCRYKYIVSNCYEHYCSIAFQALFCMVVDPARQHAHGLGVHALYQSDNTDCYLGSNPSCISLQDIESALCQASL